MFPKQDPFVDFSYTKEEVMREMLQQVYQNKADFWHGKIPDNCAVNIMEVKNGNSTLVGDDLIFYDQRLCVNPYSPI